MAGGGDPDNRRDFPGGWAEDGQNAFTREGRSHDQENIFEYVQALLRLRRAHDALRGGTLWDLASDESSYIFLRESEDEKLVIAFHDGASAKTVNLSLQGTPGEAAASIAPLLGDARAALARQQLKLVLPPQSLSVFELQ